MVKKYSVTNDGILLNLQDFSMGDKYRLTSQFEVDLIARHPDAPMCSITSMSVHIGKSEVWIIRQWKNGTFHAYEWAVDPSDPADQGRRGKKICLQTHPDSAMACKQNVDAEIAAHWQENAARLNEHRSFWTNPSSGCAVVGAINQESGPGAKIDPSSGSVVR